MKSGRFLSCLEADDIEKKINELTKYLVRAMSSHSYYLISIIVYIFSKLKLNDDAIRQLESKRFLDTVNTFVLEFAEKKEADGTRVRDNVYFTNIVYYMLGFFLDHIDNNSADFGRE